MKDVNKETAAKALGIGVKDVAKDQRSLGAAINFGTLYGRSGKFKDDVDLDAEYDGIPTFGSVSTKDMFDDPELRAEQLSAMSLAFDVHNVEDTLPLLGCINSNDGLTSSRKKELSEFIHHLLACKKVCADNNLLGKAKRIETGALNG